MDKSILKRALTICCAVLLFIGCGKILNYILVDDTRSYTRIMFHQLYNVPQNIDVVFLGSSHVYQSLDPAIADKEFGKYTFNAGSSSQSLDGSFAIMQEICDNNRPEYIFLELYYVIADDKEYSEYKSRTQMTATYLLTDYMKPSLRKFKYMLDASSDIHYVNTFIPARRNWKKIFDLKSVIDLIHRKQNDDYINFRWKKDGKNAYYVDRGFVADDKTVDLNVCWNKLAYGSIKRATKITVENDWYKSLLQIINFCKDKKIKLVLFIAPEPEWTIVGKGNYQEYHNSVLKIANKYDIEFIDFNFCKPKYLDTREFKLFQDEQHLNTAGAQKFSKVFSEFFTGKVSKDMLLYESLEEKLNAEAPYVYGFAGLHNITEKGVKAGYVISNRRQGIEYKIEAETAGSQRRLLQDFSENRKFTLPLKEKGKLKVSWRLKTKPDDIFVVEAGY